MEKKKFKINIIDIIIVVLIICVAVFAVLKFSDGGNPVSAATDTSKVRITYFHECATNYVIDSAQIGDPVYDGSSEQNMGVVTAIKTGAPIATENVPYPTEGYHYSVFVTTEAEGTWTDHGVVVNGTIYAPGHTLVIYAGDAKLYLTVYSVELLED